MTAEQAEIERARTAHIERTMAHYFHAREKHPYFADILSQVQTYNQETAAQVVQDVLAKDREWLVKSSRLHECAAIEQVARYELTEICVAIAKGDAAQAVSECYDAIAVLLRVVDVLEGRQKLGMPEKEAVK